MPHRAAATLAALAIGLSLPSAASAQAMMDLPIWSNGILGQSALRNTYDNYNRANGLDKGSKAEASTRPCSADALPAGERRKMEAEYARRLRANGKADADLYVREQGMAFHRKLVAEGVCPAPGAKDQTPRATRAEPETGKDGKRCRMVTRPIANVSGGGMTMGMVPVCD